MKDNRQLTEDIGRTRQKSLKARSSRPRCKNGRLFQNIDQIEFRSLAHTKKTGFRIGQVTKLTANSRLSLSLSDRYSPFGFCELDFNKSIYLSVYICD